MPSSIMSCNDLANTARCVNDVLMRLPGIPWLKCEYMLDKVGRSYAGVISTVTDFGLFVELKEVYVEGLVHISTLDDDFYQYDNLRYTLKGERSGKRYRLGDPIEIIVSRVDLDDRKIDFMIRSDGKSVKRRRRK